MRVFIFFFSIALMIILPVYCDEPNDICLILSLHNDSLKHKMNERITQENLFDKNKPFKIKVIPYFSFIPSNLKKEFDLSDLRLEKQVNMFVILYGNSPFYIHNYYFDEHKIHVDKSSEYQMSIQLAQSKSDCIFLLWAIGNPIIGFVEKSKIKFVDEDLKVYESIQDLIDYRYGNLGTYLSELERLKFEEDYLAKTERVDDAREIFKNDISYLLNHDFKDINLMINAVIFKISLFIKLTDYQKKELSIKLSSILEEAIKGKGILSRNKIDLYSEKGMFFINSIETDINNVIENVLFYNQRGTYLANEDLYQKLALKSKKIIFDYYKNERKITNDSTIKATIKKEIFEN